MDGLIVLVGYLLAFNNFVVFCISMTVLTLTLWVMLFKASFLELFDQWNKLAKWGGFSAKFQNIQSDDYIHVDVFSGPTIVILTISISVALLTFWGCCGALRENTCMLGSYFFAVLISFILLVVGCVLLSQGNLTEALGKPLRTALAAYDDNPEPGSPLVEYKILWNKVQRDFKCCGIDSVKDWQDTKFDFSGANKPEGCCQKYRFGFGGRRTQDNVDACRMVDEGYASNMYYFEGCLNKFVWKLEDNFTMVAFVTIALVAFMVPNMLFSYALCTVGTK